MYFENLNIIKPIQKALKAQGYKEATPIQAQSIPPLLKGADLLGCAQTGTGKTAAFAIPILQDLAAEQTNRKGSRQIRTLVLAPTRELAIQIGESFEAYGKYLDLKTLTIFGGVSQHPQTKSLKQGVDILVATPGRLLDLINQKFIYLDHVEHFVLDEADRMLDMGMLRDVRKIIKYIPTERQTMFFSATMPAEIAKLADSILCKPEKIEITPESPTVDIIEQSVYHVNKKNKIQLLTHILKAQNFNSVLVFSRTKHGADKIVKMLSRKGVVAQAIHGNKSQNARQRALGDFKSGRTRVLVATDIAARGIDVEELSCVINYDLPEVPETYVHRIGRTGRAGQGGVAIAFCDDVERPLLRQIQKLIKRSIKVVDEHPYPYVKLAESEVDLKPKQTSNKPSSQQRKNRRPAKGSYGSRKQGSSQKSSSQGRRREIA
ncbi:DEAD/DEAH box helicase [Clostridia bacterium]|nr:DEAD/DEAH box helicase [Clostridia bacterium]